METYEELKMNIIFFDAEDVIVTSGDENEDEGVIVLPFLPAGG